MRRDILELRAEVEPGDSGGPLVLENGTIGGLVFAESRADESVGYALTPTQRRGPDRPGDRPDRRRRRRRVPALTFGGPGAGHDAGGVADTPTGVRRGARAPARARVSSTRHPGVVPARHPADSMARMERMTSSAALGRLTAEYWETYLEANPLNATAIGDPRFDDRLADHTPAGTAATIARFEALLARADALDPARETPADRTTLSALRGSLAADIAELRTGILEWNVNPLEGAPVDFLTIPAYQRLETPEDGERMIARWRAMGALHGPAARRRCARAWPTGASRACRPIRRTITVLEEVLDAPIERWPLLDPISTLDEVDGLVAEEQKSRFTRELHGRSRRRSGRRSSASTTPSCSRSSRRRDPTASPACARWPAATRAITTSSGCTPRSTSTRRSSTAPGTTRSTASTARSSSSRDAPSASRRSGSPCRRCARTPACSSPRGRRCSTRRPPASSAPGRSRPGGSGACRWPRA